MPKDSEDRIKSPVSNSDKSSPESLTNHVSFSVEWLLDILKKIGEIHALYPDYVWIEIYRDGSWILKVDGRFNDDIEERVISGDSIHEDFLGNVAHWFENQ